MIKMTRKRMAKHKAKKHDRTAIHTASQLKGFGVFGFV